MEQQAYIDEENEISLKDIIRILLHRKWWLVVTFLLVVTGVMFYLYTATPMYTSSATLWIEPSSSGSSVGDMFSMNISGGSTKIATEVEIIKSRRNFEKMIDELNLLSVYRDRYDYDQPLTMDRLIRQLEQTITVSTVKDTNIVRITAEHDDYLLARDMVNTLSDVYNDLLKNLAQNEYSVRREFIQSQINPTFEEVKDAEDRLREFKEENGIFLLEEEAKSLLGNIARYEIQIDPYLLQRKEALNKQEVYAQVIREEGGRIVPYERVRSNSTIRENVGLLTDTLLELVGYHSQEASLVSSSRVEELTTRAARMENEIRAQTLETVLSAQTGPVTPFMRNNYMQLANAYVLQLLADVNISYLTQLKESYEARMSGLPKMEQDFIRLQRDLKVKENLYLLLLENLEESKLMEAAVAGTSRIIDEAVADNRPIKPNKKMLLAVGALLGLFLGALLAFLIEAIDDSVKDEETVKRSVGENIPIVGRIPHLQIDAKEHLKELVVFNDPISPGAEAYKHIATNVLYSSVKKPQIICISSTEPGAGKTGISSNTAIAMAQNGLKTLLLDADMRKPRLEEAFELSRATDGLVNYLLMDVPFKDVIIQPLEDLETLHMLPVGPIPPNPTSLITSDKFKNMFSELLEYYDQIVIDLPPLMAASDGLIISRYGDGIVLVVRMGSTSKQALRVTADNIISSDITILGVVENDLTRENSTGYGYYNYYYTTEEQGNAKKRKRRSESSREKNSFKFGMNGRNGSAKETDRKAQKPFDTQASEGDAVQHEPEPDKKKPEKHTGSALTKSSIDFLSELEAEELGADGHNTDQTDGGPHDKG